MPYPSNQDNYTIEFDKLVIICLNSGADNLLSTKGQVFLPESTGLTDSQIVFKENALKAANAAGKDTVVLEHNPPVGDGATTQNVDESKQLNEKYNVAGDISGHLHKRDKITINGIDYWQCPSLAQQGMFEEFFVNNHKLNEVPIKLYPKTVATLQCPADLKVSDGSGWAGFDSSSNPVSQSPETVCLVESNQNKDISETVSVKGTQSLFAVTGSGTGPYKLDAMLTDTGNKFSVQAETNKGQRDVFNKDWQTNATAVSRDANGDGVPDYSFTTSNPAITENDFVKASQPANSDSSAWLAAVPIASGGGIITYLVVRKHLRRKRLKLWP